MSEGWNTIESDAGVFTSLLDSLGVTGVQFEELLSLDAESLAELHPVYGVIFLFKYPTNTPYRTTTPLDGAFDHDAAASLFFAAQTIQNACGTQALLSVLLNKTALPAAEADQEIALGPALLSFRDFAMPLPADMRGEALSNSSLIRDVHNSFARSNPFVNEAQRPADGEGEDAFHFIAYSSVNGVLYELDGLQPAPISHGPCAPAADEFAAKVMEVIRRRVARYEASEIRFNLLAMVRDLREKAREIGDEEMLEREERKRLDWQFENALRRHNFVGFAGEVLKGVVAQQLHEKEFDLWVGEATKRYKKRLGERKKGGEDVEMKG